MNKSSVTKKCCDCSNTVNSPNQNSVYCQSCYFIRKDDICEVIDPSGKITIITKNNLNSLNQLLISYSNIQVRLDLHGVLDTLTRDIQFENPDNNCCISFVGNTTGTRIHARTEILNRIGNQIKYGVLVFKRGKNNNKNTFNDVGGKAWINNLIPLDPNKLAIFIDDSNDHYESVKNKKIPNLGVHLFIGS